GQLRASLRRWLASLLALQQGVGRCPILPREDPGWPSPLGRPVIDHGDTETRRRVEGKTDGYQLPVSASPTVVGFLLHQLFGDTEIAFSLFSGVRRVPFGLAT